MGAPKPFRTGKISEFRNGTLFLTHIEWEDGHEEIEVHECKPTLLFQAYDRKSLEEAHDLLHDFRKVLDAPAKRLPDDG